MAGEHSISWLLPTQLSQSIRSGVGEATTQCSSAKFAVGKWVSQGHCEHVGCILNIMGTYCEGLVTYTPKEKMRTSVL